MTTDTNLHARWRQMRPAAALFGLASAASGVTDFLWHDFERAHQPIQTLGEHIPGIKLLAFITAAAMIAGGFTMLKQSSAHAGAGVLALVYFAFGIFWLPRFYTAPHALGLHIPLVIGLLSGVGIELVAVAGAALVYHAMRETPPAPESSWPRAVLLARWIIALCSIDFGLYHLVAMNDVLVYVPKWLPPSQAFWAGFTGICFILAGLAILTKIQDVVAARLLAAMFLVFNFLALPQFILADPHDHAAWGGNSFNLVLVAACWLLADAILLRRGGQNGRPL
jgi:uncharacterized membrane protein